MKLVVSKCEDCGKIFESITEYSKHVEGELAIKHLQKKYPLVEDDTCKFANGGYSVQRTKKFYNGYKNTVIKMVNNRYIPMSYGWFRCLDDGGSIYYSVACRISCICKNCYKEWGQQYYANKCCGGAE